MVQKHFPVTFPESPKIEKFPKCKHSTENHLEIQEENQMEREFLASNPEIWGYM